MSTSSTDDDMLDTPPSAEVLPPGGDVVDTASTQVTDAIATVAVQLVAHSSAEAPDDTPPPTEVQPPEEDVVDAVSPDTQVTDAAILTVEVQAAESSPAESADPIVPSSTEKEHVVADPITDSLPPIVRSVRLPRFLRHRIVSIGLLILLFLSIITPLIVAASYGMRAYSTYTTLSVRAHSGLQHLLNVRSLFTGNKTNLTGVLNPDTLMHARKEFTAARTDFVQVQSLLDSSALIGAMTQYLPQYRPQIATAHAASQIGIDVADIGQELVTAALTFAPKLHGPLLSEKGTPLVTPADLNLVRTTIITVLPLLDDIQKQSHSLSIDALPVTPHQREQVRQLLQLLPQMETVLRQGQGLVNAAGWLLGVNGPRTFLVQTMDRAELRPTGGFTGQYGELQINGGRVAPFSLHDISLVEYADNSPTSDQRAPEAYRSWWPFANWGLRDSNLSADFPTSAQIAIHQYKLEVNRNVDGVILFSPFLVEHILQIIGPISIPNYKETITAQNMEERLHYYQLDNVGIRQEEIIEHVEDPLVARKRFTALVAHMLMDRVRHISPQELLAIAFQMAHDIKTKDLQVYVTNPQIEDLLTQYGYAVQVDRSTMHDGLYVVQANVSASKASQYVRTTIHDTVNLDAAGGATHVMQLRLAYTQLGPVYGLDTYRDYVRVYVPPSATLLWGDGFDTGIPLCGGPLANCPDNGVYPHDELVCPTGQYFAGASAPMIDDLYAGQWHPLDKIGPPPNRRSDEPGRAMFGGLVVVPKNCSMMVTLSWYVPPLGHGGPGAYDLLVQRQASIFPELDLTVLPTPSSCGVLQTLGQHVETVLTQDTFFSSPRVRSSHGITADCYPQPQI